MLNNTLSHYLKTLAGTGQSSGSPSHKAPSRGIHLTSVIALVSAAAIALSGAIVPVPSQAGETGWNNNITTPGSMQPVQLLSLTDDTSNVKVPDTGVATYVGGNMYVGEKIGSTPEEVQKHLNAVATTSSSGITTPVPATDGITGSYASEAEGLTLVDGRLAMRQLKYSWSGRGFRFGIAGYGAQFRPIDGEDVEGNMTPSVALAVRGNDDFGITKLQNDAHRLIASWNTNSVNYGDYNDLNSEDYGMPNYGGAWLGNTNYNDISYYEAAYIPWSGADGCEDGDEKNCEYPPLPLQLQMQKKIYYRYRNALGDVYYKNRKWYLPGDLIQEARFDAKKASDGRYSSFKVNGTDYVHFKTDTLQKDSSRFASMMPTGEVTISSAPDASNLTRYKYNYYEATKGSYSFAFDPKSLNEKLITFTGDGVKQFQVFTLKASDLSDSYNGQKMTGVDFWFRNIPKGAAVVVNVVNDEGKTTNSIDFHNGWRIWWGGDATSKITDSAVEEIGGGYSKASANSTSNTESYVDHAQQLLWNFPNTTQLTVRGGQGSGTQTTRIVKDGADSLTTQPLSTYDDPAASSIGSIYVPNGSFQSHVSTNGRVYVGEDFEMDNPTPIKKSDGSEFINVEHSGTASVIDMDQERHNLPWYGSYFNDASMLEWGKVSLGSKSQLGGSTWSIYGTTADAKNRKNAIATVTDNGFNDYAPKEGEIAVRWLQPNANYYIVETNPPAGYKRSTNIYTAQTTNTGYSMNTLTSRVYDSSGNQIDDNAATTARKLDKTTFSDGTFGYSVLDALDDASVSWTKYSSGDQSKTGLPGSEWTLTNTKTNEGWTVSDNTTPATAVAITKADGSEVKDGEYINAYQSLALAAKVAPSQANQRVIWKSSDDNVAVVSDGVVTGTGGGNTTITACAESTPGICASLKVTVGTVNVSLLRVYSALDADKAVVQVSGNPKATLSATGSMEMFTGTHVKMGAVVEPSTTKPFKPIFTPLDPSIVSVDPNGVVTAKKSGETTIVVRAGNKTARVNISVSDHNMNKDGTLADTYIIYFHKGSGTWYGSRQGSDGSWSDGAWTDDTWNTNDVFLRYQWGDYDWGTVGMKPAACNKDYVYTVLEGWQHIGGRYWSLGGEFLFTNRRQNAWYKQKHDGHTYTYDGKPVYFNFSYEDYGFPMSPAMTVKDSERLNEAPLGCPTKATLDMLDATVLRTWPLDSNPSALDDTAAPVGITPTAGQDAVNEGRAGTPDASSSSSDGNVLVDVDPAVGSFTVAGLQDGDYTLKEKTSPAGFTLNPTGYSFTVKSGKVTWSDAAQSHVVDGRLFVADSPTQVTWYKTDADAKGEHQRLGGSQWRITSADGNSGYCIADGSAVIDQSVCAGKELKDYAKADGVLTVKGLPAGYYTLQEVVAPANYRLSNETYSLMISADSHSTLMRTVTDSSTGALTQQAVPGNEVQDKRQLGSVQWNKTDEHGTKLRGSGWKLTFVPQGGTKADAETRDVVDWDTASGERPAECNSDAAAMPWQCDTAGEAGVFSLTNLPWGTYTLTETKVPAGHTALDKPTVSFTISPKSMHPDLGDIVNKTAPIVKPSAADSKVSMTKLAQTGLPSDVMMLLLLSTALVACGIAVFASQRVLRRRSK